MRVGKLSIGDDKPAAAGFDICPPKQAGSVVLKPPLLLKNREKRQSSNSRSNVVVSLRPGMVFLKGYLSLSDQEMIVKRCRELGVGSGGFYQPGYGEDTKMHLKMMCLEKNWDPQFGQYGDRRPFDGAKPTANSSRVPQPCPQCTQGFQCPPSLYLPRHLHCQLLLRNWPSGSSSGQG